MEKFSALLDRLIFTLSRTGKIELLARYLRDTPDPDRGWALAALTGSLSFPAVKPAQVRSVISARVDPLLFRLSRDFVGDTAETVSLLWPGPDLSAGPPLSITEAVEAMQAMTRQSALKELPDLLDRLDPKGRFALLKMAMGAMRIGLSARLARTAFAEAFNVSLDDVEQSWHGLTPPYTELFDWAAHGAAKPDPGLRPAFRPFMLAHPLEDEAINLADYAAEWKWDGIRVQLVHSAGETRLFSRGGDEITHSFPELLGAFTTPGAVDGELLVRGSEQGGAQGGAASVNALQQRLGRKTVTAKMLQEYPAFVRVYDLLHDGKDDLRALPWSERRPRLEAFATRLPPSHFDVSALIEADNLESLQELRLGARDAAIEGIMLKRRDSPYISGRKAGLWYKWKRDPLVADCVLMYAQRGSGKRSGLYSDLTFGCWTHEDGERDLLPVGKAYSGFTDAELKELDKFVRQNTINRFGPVREVNKLLVLEVAFDSIHLSTRHKSGVAMRFPRINRIRLDKPAREANTIADLTAMIATSDASI